MKLINKKHVETVYEIELTQGEVDILTAALGMTSTATREKMFEEHKLSAPSVNNHAGSLYAFLEGISSFTK